MMAKFKLQAGMELDLLTQREVMETLADWTAEIARGVRFRQISGQTVAAGGVWTIGGASPDNRSDTFGPEAGMCWAVTRLALSGSGIVAGTDLWSVFINDASPSKLVRGGLTRGYEWIRPSLVLNPGDRLIASGAATGTAGDPVVLSGAAVEVPIQLAWQLL